MSVDLVHNQKAKKTYVIKVSEGDTVQFRINDSPVINATVAVGTQGTIRLEYTELVS